MTSNHFFTLVLIGGGVTLGALSGVGCGGGDSGTSTGGSTTTSTKTLTHSTTSSTTTSSSSTDTGPHDPSAAIPIDIDSAATQATLVDTATSDWYSFSGKAGDRLVIGAFAYTGLPNGGFDTTVVDTTLVLLGPDMNPMNPLTYQSDEWPAFGQDAVLYVQIPADGTYYIGVQDCNGLFSSGCSAAPSDVTNLDYELLVAHTSALTSPELVADTTKQDGTLANAQAVTYKVPSGGKAGQYGEALIGGSFKNATDTHVYAFTPPADTVTSAGARARAEFYVQPIGGFQGGDLSDANIQIWVTDSTGNVIISQSDQNKYLTNDTSYSLLEFSAPITVGTQYYLFVKNTQTSGTPVKDFYFISHYLNPLIDVAEKEGPTGTGMNDTSATAEALTGQGSSKDFFTVDGNISAPGASGDIDWFSFTVPGGVTQYQIQCDAERSGSGLGGFTAELYDTDGTTMLNTATETSDADLVTTAANAPTAGKKIFLKVNAATQDAKVTGTQYRCYVFFG